MTLCDDRAVYPEWLEDMRDTIENVRPGCRSLFNWLESIPTGVRYTEKWDAWDQEGTDLGLDDVNKDLWAVMYEKTDGSAKRKVKAVRGYGV